MRTIKAFSVLAVVASLFIAAPSHALLAGVTYIDFTGWDSTLIDNGVGQTFSDVFPHLPGPAVDVHVRGIGSFSRASKYSGGFIRDGLLNTNESDRFEFTFTRSLPVVIMSARVDSQESVRIVGVGPETYTHDSGAVPTVVPTSGGDGIIITGTGVGQDPTTGASMGETETAAQMGLAVRVTHSNTNRPNKYEQFKVGTTLIPEPSSLGLFGFCLLGSLLFRNRR